MVLKVNMPTIVYGMHNIFHALAFITVLRSVFPPDNVGRVGVKCVPHPLQEPLSYILYHM